MASRMFLTILAAASAVTYASAAVTTLTMPVPNGPTPTMSGPMTISTMQFEPIDTISGFTTFIVHHGGPTATSSSVPASITASASVSASASASTSATPGLPFKLPGIQLPTIQHTMILSPTDVVMKIGAIGVLSTQSCKWAPGPSPTATCVGGIAGINVPGATMTVPVGPVEVTLAPHNINGASTKSVTSWAVVGVAAAAAWIVL